MKIKALLLALFVAGIGASIAVAKPPPGHGKGHGKSSGDAAEATTGTDTTGTDTTGTTGTGTTSTTGKVLMCHRTGSKKHPYVLVSVSAHSAHARGKHKGDLPATGGSCPTTPPGTTTTGTTTTGTTTTTTTSTSG